MAYENSDVNAVVMAVLQEISYIDLNWPPPEPPRSSSEELRMIRQLLAESDEKWRNAKDEIWDGRRLSVSDFDNLRKIAGVAIRAMLQNRAMVLRGSDCLTLLDKANG